MHAAFDNSRKATTPKGWPTCLSYIFFMHNFSSFMYFFFFFSPLPVGDPVSRWWAVVLKAAVYWLQGDDVAVKSLLAEAERMPRALHILE